MSKFDEDLHDEEQGADVLDKVAAAAPLQTKNEAAVKQPAKDESDEGVIRQNSVYDVPKKWHKAIKEKGYSTFSSYAKAAIKEKLERDGLI